jgi:hypothetical protein
MENEMTTRTKLPNEKRILTINPGEYIVSCCKTWGMPNIALVMSVSDKDYTGTYIYGTLERGQRSLMKKGSIDGIFENPRTDVVHVFEEGGDGVEWYEKGESEEYPKGLIFNVKDGDLINEVDGQIIATALRLKKSNAQEHRQGTQTGDSVGCGGGS